MTKKEYEHARLSGELARQAGRKRDACPKYGFTEDARLLREAWQTGFDDEDERRRK